jgi:hypothetical protein
MNKELQECKLQPNAQFKENGPLFEELCIEGIQRPKRLVHAKHQKMLFTCKSHVLSYM